MWDDIQDLIDRFLYNRNRSKKKLEHMKQSPACRWHLPLKAMCGECLSTWWRWRLVFLLFLFFFFFLFLLPLNSIVLFLFLPLSDWFFFYLPIIIHWVSISRKTKTRTILHNIKSELNYKSFLYPRQSYNKPIHISLKSKKSNRIQIEKKPEKKNRAKQKKTGPKPSKTGFCPKTTELNRNRPVWTGFSFFFKIWFGYF